MIQRAPQLTIAQYEQMAADGEFDSLDERVELIRGELHFMSPESDFHIDVVAYLIDWTSQVGRIHGYMCYPQLGVKFEELLSIPEPDVAWVKRRRFKRGKATLEDLGLIIEVSRSLLHYDRTVKASLYAEALVPEYWIANCGEETIEVYRASDGQRFTKQFVVRRGERVSPLVAPEAWLIVEEVYADE